MSQDFIYTSPNDAVKELKRRRADTDLQKKIREYLGDDIPEFISKELHIVLFRHITTANTEVDRLIELSKELELTPISLEYNQDKFVAFNPDKYSLLYNSIKVGKKDDGEDRLYRVKIADINTFQGKPFTEIKTLWGENLIDFHHKILTTRYPDFSNKFFDISKWLHDHGERAKYYYEKFLVLLLQNGILAESFEFKGDEGKFMDTVFLPAFKKVEELFGIKPLVIQLAPETYQQDPTWWYPKEEIKTIINQHILEYKQNVGIVH
jgi:hypothetical protein